MARPFSDGPLTVTPAKTYTTPKGVYNDVGDASGSIPGSPLGTPGPYIRTSPSAPGSPVSHTLQVVLHNVPGNNPEACFIVAQATDRGAIFTQDQLNKWTDLGDAIRLGYLNATATGTVPATEV